MTEFELIERYFQRETKHALVGNGDDAAVIAPSPGHAFVVTTDAMLEGRHFLPTLDPVKLGRRIVNVNLSDLAAMGATPRYAMLALALPRIDETWVARFAEGLWTALDEFDIELIGGNTTRGALSCTMTAFGEVERVSGAPQVLLRSGARAEDDLWISGSLGDAGWALACMTGIADAEASREQIAKYELPTARVALGRALHGIASACIDVSDGLISEANHIARASNVVIDIEFAQLPTSLGDVLTDARYREHATQCLLATGDVYELLFTAPPTQRETIQALFDRLQLNGARIGHVRSHDANDLRRRVQVLDRAGRIIDATGNGWDHFA
jgi:thiamine-monophosphate kinase